MCVAILDPRTGAVTYCTAGHPPPLALSGDERAAYLPPTGGRPLGGGGPFEVAEHHLAEDALLILYSNGLVARPGRTPMRSTAEVMGMADAVRDRELDDPLDDLPLVQRLCSGLVEEASREGFVDDITLLAVQRVAPIAPLSVRLPAQSDAPRLARRRLVDWLEPLSVRGIDEAALQHSVSELVRNAVEHAYARRPPGRTSGRSRSTPAWPTAERWRSWSPTAAGGRTRSRSPTVAGGWRWCRASATSSSSSEGRRARRLASGTTRIGPPSC